MIKKKRVIVKGKEANPREYCQICKDARDFILPTELFEALTANKLVIFAGAGISTENKYVFPYTFYEDIVREINYTSDIEMPFSRVMSEYCRKTGGKQELIKRIKERIDYIESFPELYRSATRFHNQLARIPCITEIITTNWDDYFEQECHATPFSYEKDMVFWNETKRKVLKLHGSINNLGSLVATNEDYEERYQSLNTGLIGGQLKLLIANNRIVFIGYSFKDEDFNRIYSYLRGQLNDFLMTPYVVTLDDTNDSKWKEMGLEPIYTSGEHFLHIIRTKLETKGCVLTDDDLLDLNKELSTVIREHQKLVKINLFKYPEAIFCISYQDGVIHAFEHLLHHVSFGESLCKDNIHRILMGYEHMLEKKKKVKKWYDIAYIQGYINGHVYALVSGEDRKYFPRYFDYSLTGELHTYNEYKDSLGITEGRKKYLSNYAVKFVKKNLPHKSIVIHHTPFLL